jgi:chromosome segregation ATPase
MAGQPLEAALHASEHADATCRMHHFNAVASQHRLTAAAFSAQIAAQGQSAADTCAQLETLEALLQHLSCRRRSGQLLDAGTSDISEAKARHAAAVAKAEQLECARADLQLRVIELREQAKQAAAHGDKAAMEDARSQGEAARKRLAATEAQCLAARSCAHEAEAVMHRLQAMITEAHTETTQASLLCEQMTAEQDLLLAADKARQRVASARAHQASQQQKVERLKAEVNQLETRATQLRADGAGLRQAGKHVEAAAAMLQADALDAEQASFTLDMSIITASMTRAQQREGASDAKAQQLAAEAAAVRGTRGHIQRALASICCTAAAYAKLQAAKAIVAQVCGRLMHVLLMIDVCLCTCLLVV